MFDHGMLTSDEHGGAVCRREEMVREQIVARGIRNAELLRVMRAVPRHRFVADAEQGRAYADHPMAIGGSQTISQPYVVALMTNELLTGRRERVLEIGTGCGYQTAILASLFARVYTVERIGHLAAGARRRLQGLGYRNIEFYHRDGHEGGIAEEGGGGFDAILVACAASEAPPQLLRQLLDGGRMIIPIGVAGGHQTLAVFERSGDAHWERRDLCGVAFVPMRAGVE